MTMLRIGLVGLGRLGKIHAEILSGQISNVDLVAVCTLDDKEKSWAVSKLGLSATCCFSDFEKMLDEAKLDAVVLASPSSYHFNQTYLALSLGIHVFCEKPLAVKEEKIQNLFDILNTNSGLVCQVGFMRRFDPVYMKAKEKIVNGDIGEIILFRGYSLDPISEIHNFLKFLPSSSGQFLDMAVHDIDMANWLIDAFPKTIYSCCNSFSFREFEEFGEGDNVTSLMQYENGSMAFIMAGRTAQHGYHIETEIIGTKGTIRIGSVPSPHQLEILDGSGVRRECYTDFADRFYLAFQNELVAFIKNIHEDEAPKCGIHEAYKATLIALKATESLKEKTLIKL